MRVKICTKAYARAALVGNPSDGYGGRTISVVVKNFWAEVRLAESARLEVLPASQHQCCFSSLDEFLRDQRLNGYGGLRLVKASIKRFAQWCAEERLSLPVQNFRITCSSCIPRQVGLAGSSAIVTATLRALFEFYGITIRKELLPNLSLAVETEELGISAGLQDRVAQVYEGLTFMDFDCDFMQHHGHGRYESLDTSLLPPLYVAYQNELGESSEIVHNDLRRRFSAGDKAVISAMHELADLTLAARSALLAGDHQSLHALMDRNFDIRQSICRLPPKHVRMVERARSCGASANFTGSGGAIVGTYADRNVFADLQHVLEEDGCQVIQPLYA